MAERGERARAERGGAEPYSQIILVGIAHTESLSENLFCVVLCTGIFILFGN